MSDVNKKINLDIGSNVKDIIPLFKELSANLNNIEKTINSIIKANENLTKAQEKTSRVYSAQLKKEYEEAKKLNAPKFSIKYTPKSRLIDDISRHNLFESDVGKSIADLANIPEYLFGKLQFKSDIIPALKESNVKNIGAIDKELEKLSKVKKLTPKQKQTKDDLLKERDKLSKYSTALSGMEIAASGVKAVFSSMLIPLKNLTQSIVSTTNQFLNLNTGLATYNMSTSLISNQSARTAQMAYGLTSSQYFGFSQAASLLNIKNEEDYMYMNSAQRDLFNNYVDKYTKMYDELSSTGVLQSIQEMQLDFAEFKTELSLEFLKWIGNNKDAILTTIKTIMQTTMTVAQGIMSIANWLFANNSSVNYDATTSAQARVVINVDSQTTINSTDNLDTNTISDNISDSIAEGCRKAGINLMIGY